MPHGCPVGAIFKDWDRLRQASSTGGRGLLFLRLCRSGRTPVGADAQGWVSYPLRGGAAAGLLLGVVILRRRPARSNSDFMRRLGRPAVLLALVLSIFLFAFGITWYAAVYPPRPLSRGWYDAYGFGVRPCCHQAWFCDVEPTDALTCEFRESDATWALSGKVLGAAVHWAALLSERDGESRCSSELFVA